MDNKETIVKNYVNAYNTFDVEGMIALMNARSHLLLLFN
jgi:hypothetical protein